jgi:dienelactone hydrolase
MPCPSARGPCPETLPRSSLARRSRWVALALVAACASSQPAVSIRRSQAEEIGEIVWKGFKSGYVTPAYERFDDTMAWSLPPTRLKEFWTGVAKQLGDLQAWHLMERTDKHGRTRLVYALDFSAGSAQGIVALNQEDMTIAALFVNPESQPVEEPSPLARTDTFVANPLPGVTAEMVRFGSDAFPLDGVVTRPRRPGSYPAVILVAGAGPLDRDATVGQNRPFRDLAEGLSSQGMVVLRYDKRTLTHAQKLDLRAVTVEQEVIEDALSGLALLRARADVKKGALFVVGHGLGAQLAPEIAQRDGQVTGLVLMAPPARAATEAVIEQLRFLDRTPPEELARLEKQAADIRAGTALPGETFVGAPVSYFLDLQKHDGIATAQTLRRPLLLLRGSRDYQVTDQDFSRWRQALKGQPGISATVFPGLNHLFFAGKGKPNPDEYLVASKMAKVVFTRIAAFVRSIRPLTPQS